ncbi:MAG: PA0069 family radical SAM protein [Verrucomicrobiae bacterium]|nr:PA0069 family radical SAM protein [Verrucomicrobiae bacterium]
MQSARSRLRGRGTAENPPNRFERLALEPDPECPPEERTSAKTRFFRDATASVISYNTSPDIPYEASLNPYRGCEHGCIYCYARPTHEYLGFSCGLDFETKILVKENAPELLRRELASPRWRPRELSLSGVTDPYQPVERRLRLTRRCLEVLAEFRNPVSIVTKDRLITRDLDLLSELARHDAVSVHVSMTTLDEALTRVLEPRTSPPGARLETIAALAKARVPVGVLVAPVIPGLNDHEPPSILQSAAQAGATFAAYQMLRLPHGVGPLFERWLDEHFPMRKKKVLDQVRAVRGGKLNDSRFGARMTGEGILAEQIAAMFDVARRRARLHAHAPELSTKAFRQPAGPQMALFE